MRGTGLVLLVGPNPVTQVLIRMTSRVLQLFCKGRHACHVSLCSVYLKQGLTSRGGCASRTRSNLQEMMDDYNALLLAPLSQSPTPEAIKTCPFHEVKWKPGLRNLGYFFWAWHNCVDQVWHVHVLESRRTLSSQPKDSHLREPGSPCSHRRPRLDTVVVNK